MKNKDFIAHLAKHGCEQIDKEENNKLFKKPDVITFKHKYCLVPNDKIISMELAWEICYTLDIGVPTCFPLHFNEHI